MLMTITVISRLSTKAFCRNIPARSSYKKGLSSLSSSFTDETDPTCVAKRHLTATARDVVPDENEAVLPYRALNKPQIVELRKQFMGPNQTYFFKDDPLLVMRAKGQYLYDEHGVKYLDCINNVAHIGHCHPTWSAAVGRQLAEQATNVRFLHPAVSELASRIANTMPQGSNLSVTYFVNSGSEAIDLALRLARAHTGGEDVVVFEGAYHGTLTSTTAFSPYKYHNFPVEERERRKLPPDWVHIAPCPDPFRGKFRDTDCPPDRDVDDFLAAKYSDDLDEMMTKAVEGGRKFGIFIAESIQSCGGQVIYPRDYLRRAYAVVRKHGGLCVADEVQCGFGRVGSHYWGWQTHQGAVPDIVIIGKSMGNGFPVAGVVTRPDIAASFTRHWPEFFNTFGGNPVSATAGLAVMEVLETEGLAKHAVEMGKIFDENLPKLAAKYPEIVGQVRGQGLMYGIDIVADPKTRAPNTKLAIEIKSRLRLDHHIIVSTDGPYDNVIKIKPPMCFNSGDVKNLIECLDKVIAKLSSKKD